MRDSRIANCVIHGQPVSRRLAMLTTMTDADWTTVLKVFAASRSRRGDKGRDE
jgi:hypothetical protein